MASNWFGFVQKPTDVAQPGKFNVLAKPSGVRPDMTVNRSHFLPQLAKGSITETAVPLAPDIQLKPIEQTMDMPGGQGKAASFRVFLGSLPASAVAGDVLVSVPLDLLTGRLSSTKAAYEGKEWDLVCWMAASAIYYPNASATTSGGIIVVCSPDPTRTIADVARDARVDAAFQYGPNMLASNLWSTGMALKLAIDSERKYQSFSVATDSDEALKLGGAGRVEFICSGSYSGTSSPGMLAMDIEVMFTNQVPISISGSSASSSASLAVFYDATVVAQTMRSLDSNYTWQAFVGGTAGTGGTFGLLPFTSTPADAQFDFMSKGNPSNLNTAGGAYSTTNPQFTKGGLSSLGFRFVSYDAASARYTLSCPPGKWSLMLMGANTHVTMGTITFSGPLVVTNYSTSVFTYGPSGTMTRAACTVDGGATGAQFQVSIGAPSGTPVSASASCLYEMRATMVVSTFTRLIDGFAAARLLASDRFALLELENTVTDTVEAAEEQMLQSQIDPSTLSDPLIDIAEEWANRGLVPRDQVQALRNKLARQLIYH
jgi:hypothetical protein